VDCITAITATAVKPASHDNPLTGITGRLRAAWLRHPGIGAQSSIEMA